MTSTDRVTGRTTKARVRASSAAAPFVTGRTEPQPDDQADAGASNVRTQKHARARDRQPADGSNVRTDAMPDDGAVYAREPQNARARVIGCRTHGIGCEHLAAVGRLVRELRDERLMGTRQLAAAAGCARSSVEKLEAARMAPRRSLLEAIAGALAPGDPGPLLERLLEAGGGCVAADTEGSRSWRDKRIKRAITAGLRPSSNAEAVELATREAERAIRKASRLVASGESGHRRAMAIGRAMFLAEQAKRLKQLSDNPSTIGEPDGHH